MNEENPIAPPVYAKDNGNSNAEVVSTPTPKIKATFRLICAAKCKRFAIEVVKANPVAQRADKFTRVSEDFLIACEANLKNFIINRVNTHPTKGKTLT